MKDKLMTLIGKRIKEIRQLKGLTQEQMALEASLDLSYYNHFENGKKNISIKNLLIITKILDIEIFEIIPPKKDLFLSKDEKNSIEILLN